ncbi:hypothetical protein, partial [Ruminococcus sp. YE78]
MNIKERFLSSINAMPDGRFSCCPIYLFRFLSAAFGKPCGERRSISVLNYPPKEKGAVAPSALPLNIRTS